jgi:hypothetical protein
LTSTSQNGFFVVIHKEASFGGGEPALLRRLRVPGQKLRQVGVLENLHQMPVVQPRPAHRPLRNVEAQGADQVEAAAGGRAGAGDVAAVLRDLRFHEHDVQHMGQSPPFQRTFTIVIHYAHKFNRKM